MTTLASKFGFVDTLQDEELINNYFRRLEVYLRVSQATITARSGKPLSAPILHLNDEQLKLLFAPRQLTILVNYPLERPIIECAASD